MQAEDNCEAPDQHFAPRLRLISSSREFKKDSWKKFKENFKITPVALNVFITAPGKEFFTAAKLLCNKNKSL